MYEKEKDFKTIIQNMDGEQLSDDSGNLKKSINLNSNENINLKILVNHTIKSKDIQTLISKNKLIDKEIRKDNYIENEIINSIYGNEPRFVSVDTSKHNRIFIGLVN